MWTWSSCTVGESEYAEALQVPHARVLHAEPSENIDAAAADLAATYAQVASAKCCLVLTPPRPARCPIWRLGAPFDWRVADVLDAKHDIRGLVAGGLDAEPPSTALLRFRTPSGSTRRRGSRVRRGRRT